MSNDLTFGGAEAIMIRDKGTANSVQGFVSRESVVIKNVTALATSFVFQLIEYIQFVISAAPAVTIAHLNVSGVWKQLVVWRNVLGVWKQSTANINVTGTWK
jgi:hypothetical protein